MCGGGSWWYTIGGSTLNQSNLFPLRYLGSILLLKNLVCIVLPHTIYRSRPHQISFWMKNMDTWSFWARILVVICRFALLAGTAVYAYFRPTTSFIEIVLMSITILIAFEETLSSLNQTYTQFRVSCIPFYLNQAMLMRSRRKLGQHLNNHQSVHRSVCCPVSQSRLGVYNLISSLAGLVAWYQGRRGRREDVVMVVTSHGYLALVG